MSEFGVLGMMAKIWCNSIWTSARRVSYGDLLTWAAWRGKQRKYFGYIREGRHMTDSQIRSSLALLAMVWCGGVTHLFAQSKTTDLSPRRVYGGWVASSEVTNSNIGEPEREASRMQRTRYQSQDNLSDGLLPPFPQHAVVPDNRERSLPQLPAASHDVYPANAPNLPALPTGQVLPDRGPAVANERAVTPPPALSNQPTSGQPLGVGRGGAPRSSPPLLPNPMNSNDRFRSPAGDDPGGIGHVSQDVRGRQGQGAAGAVPGQAIGYQRPANPNGNPGNPYEARQTPAQPAGGGNLREIDQRRLPGATPAAQGARLDPRAFASGLPYVTPAPGRYPTSPYNRAMFQTAAFQRNQQPAQANTVGPAQDGLVQSNPRANLPQFRSVDVATTRLAGNQTPAGLVANGGQLSRTQPGIYPTASYQCTTPTPSFPSTGAVPGAYVPPTLTPNLTPGLYSSNNSGYAPLFSLGQENYNVQLGRGIIGQPTVYVPGQPVRNFLRYLSP